MLRNLEKPLIEDFNIKQMHKSPTEKTKIAFGILVVLCIVFIVVLFIYIKKKRNQQKEYSVTNN